MMAELSVLNYLSEHPHRTIEVRYRSTRDLAFADSAANLRPLLRRGMVEPELNRHGFLKHLVLLVPVLTARRAVRDALQPPAPRGSITRARAQALGWPMRADRAKSCGHRRAVCGVHEVMFLGRDLRRRGA